MAAPIEDYALLGDTHTAALVSKSGSNDWYCAPRFDSPACFAELLGKDAGHWRLAPRAPSRSALGQYRKGGAVRSGHAIREVEGRPRKRTP